MTKTAFIPRADIENKDIDKYGRVVSTGEKSIWRKSVESTINKLVTSNKLIFPIEDMMQTTTERLVQVIGEVTEKREEKPMQLELIGVKEIIDGELEACKELADYISFADKHYGLIENGTPLRDKLIKKLEMYIDVSTQSDLIDLYNNFPCMKNDLLFRTRLKDRQDFLKRELVKENK